MPLGSVAVRDVLVKLLVFLVLSANLTWAAEQGAELSGACAPDAVATASATGHQDDHHAPDSASHHCCHASVHFTGLPDAPVAIPAAPPASSPLTVLADWQSRDTQPRLRPPKA